MCPAQGGGGAERHIAGAVAPYKSAAMPGRRRGIAALPRPWEEVGPSILWSGPKPRGIRRGDTREEVGIAAVHQTLGGGRVEHSVFQDRSPER